MNQILQELQSWYEPGGMLLTLIALTATFYFYRKSKAKGSLVCQWDGLTVVDTGSPDGLDKVHIYFGDRKIERLSISEIILWNAGDKTIRKGDLTETDPLTISFDDGSEILEAEIVQKTRPPILPSLSIDSEKRNLKYDFAFLEQDDGFTIRVAHTGKHIAPTVNGTIVDVPGGVRTWGRIESETTSEEAIERQILKYGKINHIQRLFLKAFHDRKRLSYVPIILGIAIIILGIVAPLILEPEYNEGRKNFIRLITIPTGLTYTAISAVMLWATRRKYPRSLQQKTEGAA